MSTERIERGMGKQALLQALAQCALRELSEKIRTGQAVSGELQVPRCDADDVGFGDVVAGIPVSYEDVRSGCFGGIWEIAEGRGWAAFNVVVKPTDGIGGSQAMVVSIEYLTPNPSTQ